MKTLFKIILVVFLLVGALLGLALYRANDIVAKFTPELEKMASEMLGTSVKLGEIDVQIFSGPKLKIERIALGEKDDTLRVESVSLATDFMELLSGKLLVTELELVKPEISIFKTPDGVKISGMPLGMKKQKTAGEAAPSIEKKSEAAPIDIQLDTFVVKNGVLTYSDPAFPAPVKITKLEVALPVSLASGIARTKGASLDFDLGGEGFKIKIKSAESALETQQVYWDGLTVSFDGNTIDSAGNLDNTLSTASAKIASSGLALKSLAKLAGMISSEVNTFAPEGSLSLDLAAKLNLKAPLSSTGIGNVKFSSVSVNIPGQAQRASLDGTIELSENAGKQVIMGKNLNANVLGQPLAITLLGDTESGNSLNLSQLAVAGFGGNLTAPLSVTIQPKKSVKGVATVTGMNLRQLVQTAMPKLGIVVEGLVQKFTANFSGPLEGNLMQALNADGQVILKDAVIPDFNLLGSVFASLRSLPAIGEVLYLKVPERYKPVLQASNTKLSSLDAMYTLSGGRINVSKAYLISDLFSLEASGSMAIGGEMNFKTMMFLSPEFSTLLVSSVKEAKTLLNDQQQIVFPLQISGTPPNILVIPQTDALVKKVTEGVIKEKANQVIENVIKNKLGSGLGGNLGGFLGF